MEIIETFVFTKQITQYLSDDEYSTFQMKLLRHPDVGVVILGSSGLRIIYYWYVNEKLIFLLFAYPKNVQGNLTQDQIRILRQVVEGELNHGRKII